MGLSAYIYSVNPFPVHVELGVLGKMVIPARPKDERFTRIEIKPRPYAVDRGNDVFDKQVDSGEKIARDIVDRNPNLGLFVADERGPTKAELQAATDKLLLEDQKRVAHGDQLWDSSNHNRSHIGSDARQACVRLGWTREWADGEARASMKRCLGCAEVILDQAVICKHCGWNQTKDPRAAAAEAPPPAPVQKAAPVS